MKAVAIPGLVLRAFDDIGRAGADGQIDFYRTTPPAKLFHSDPKKFRLLRGGNQGGKTTANAAETIWRLRGRHPFLVVPPAPTAGWIVCSSWKQSLVIQRKFYEMLPKRELAPGVRFSNKNGFPGAYVEMAYGSTLQFVTASQQVTDLASATLNFVGVDEPPPESIWSELVARISHYPDACLWMTMTPIGHPVEWIREKVDRGELSDHQFSLTVENCTPGGGLPFKSSAQIKEIEEQYLSMERAQRVHGAWEGISPDRFIEAFGEGCISDDPPPSDLVFEVGVGIDHGAKAGRQSITLVYVGELEGEVHCWIWDEAQQDGRSSTEDDGKAFLQLCGRNDVSLHELDTVVGDRAHGGDWKGNQKSNRDLVNAIARLEGQRPYKLPQALRQIRVPRKWQGSVAYGCRLMNKLAAAGRLHVHPRCEGFIDAAMHWQGDTRDPRKDRIDSARYALEAMVDARKVWGRHSNTPANSIGLGG